MNSLTLGKGRGGEEGGNRYVDEGGGETRSGKRIRMRKDTIREKRVKDKRGEREVKRRGESGEERVRDRREGSGVRE